mgnify:CR=1 FL=1
MGKANMFLLIRHCDVTQKGKMSQDVIHKQDTTTQSLAGRNVREYTYIHAELQISAVMSLAYKYSKVSIYKLIFAVVSYNCVINIVFIFSFL